MLGMSLVEVMVWLLIIGAGSTMILRDRMQTLRDQRGQQIATTLAPYNQAIYDYVQKYRDQIVNLQPITGVANPLAPTITELKAIGILPATYPLTINTNGGSPLYQVARIPAGCVGNLCDISFQFTNSLPEVDSRGLASEGVLGYAARQLGSTAGYSSNLTPGTIDFRGGFSLPNPQGNVAGIFATYNTWSASGVANFVKIGDTRDPLLQGPLTVAGPATLNGGATVNGGDLNVPANNLKVNCFKVVGSTGQAGTNCFDPTDVPSGWGGGVRTWDVVAQGSILAADAAKPWTAYAAAGFSPSAGKLAGLNFSMVQRTSLASTGPAIVDRVIPFGQYTAGTVCSEPGAIAQSAAGPGYLACVNGAWSDLVTYGAEGDACSQPGYFKKGTDGTQLVCVGGGSGAMKFVRLDRMVTGGSAGQDCSGMALGATAYDVWTGTGTGGYTTLICRQNPNGGSPRYMRLQDLVTNVSYAGAVEVTNGSVVTKPSCPVYGSQTPVAIAQMAPKTFSSPDGGVNMLVSDNGSTWTAIMTNGAGAALAGSPYATAVLQEFCYFP